MKFTTGGVSSEIAKGAFLPHQYLSNVCLSYFQKASGFVSQRMFPVVHVPLSTSYYYEFSKGDMARDHMGRKPEFGSVSPSVFGHRERQYRCEVDQVITGISKISALDFQRSSLGDMGVDPRKMKARFIGEQMALHQDVLWAEKFFNEKYWENLYQGVSGSPEEGEFLQFDCEGADPVEFISKMGTRMVLSGLRRPNKMCLGANVMASLKTNPCILDRVKYQGSESNPAHVTENVLAQLFGLDEVMVSEAVVNVAEMGQEDEMTFVCSENDVLLVYATTSPSIEEPSAGYTFAWDMMGNGNLTPVICYEGEPSSHTEYVEGLIATDHQVCCPELGVYLKGAVGVSVN